MYDPVTKPFKFESNRCFKGVTLSSRAAKCGNQSLPGPYNHTGIRTITDILGD